MRIPDAAGNCISYRLNILGLSVWKDRCQLVARDALGQWVPLGPTRPLPVSIPTDPSEAGSDTLLLTAYQYDLERPGSDLREVLLQRKDLAAATGEP